MTQQLENLFKLETYLSQGNHQHLLSTFKKIISTNSECKINLTLNPGLTLYTPKSVQNLRSTKSALIVIHELSRTGAPVVAADTARTLVENGYFVTIITMRKGPLLQELLDIGVPVIHDRELALAHDSKELLSSQNIHMCIDAFVKAFSQVIIVTAVYFNLIHRYNHPDNRPIIWWLHEGTATYDNFAYLMPQKIAPPIKVYTGGQYASDQLAAYGLSYNAKVLNYGVSDTAESISQTKHQNSISDTIEFILPGSIGLRKGQQILIDAIKLLPKSYAQKTQFTFIGDVVSKFDIDGKKIKKNLIRLSQSSPNIQYFTSVSRDKLFEFYKNADVLVLPSLDDPMPVVATEILMFGKIILCSNTTGTSYYLEDGKNGFVFESKNVNQLVDKIKYIVDHQSELAAIGKNGRKVYEKVFKMDMFEKNLLQVIKEVS